MRHLISLIFCISALLASTSSPAQSLPCAHVVTLDTTAEGLMIGKSLHYYRDEHSQLSADDVFALEDALWTPSNQDSLAFGYSNATYWLHFCAQGNDKKFDGWLSVNNPLISRVTLFAEEKDIARKLGNSGALSLDKTTIFSHNPLVRIPLAETPRRYLLKVESDTSLSLMLKLHTNTSLATESMKRIGTISLFYGIAFAMILYHSVMLASWRDTSVALYVLTSACFTVSFMTLNGIYNRYLFTHPITPDNGIIPFAMGATILCLLLLSRKFLNTKSIFPRLEKLHIALLAVTCLILTLAINSSFSTSIKWVVVFTPLSFACVAFTAVLAYRKGFKPAKYFAIAFVFPVAGTLLFSLRSQGIIPTNFITENGVQFATSVWLLFLAFALSARYRELLQGAERAQKRLQLKLDEENLRLSSEVQKRTSILEREHQAIRAALDAISLQQTRLTLSTLSAGLAHEINNPNNFISVSAQNGLTRVQKFESFLAELIDEDAPPEIRESISIKISKIRNALMSIGNASATLSQRVQGFRNALNADESEQLVTDICLRMDTLIELLKPALPASFTIDARFSFRPEILCHPASMMQILISLLKLYAEESQSNEKTILHINSARSADRLQIMFEANRPVRLDDSDMQWIGTLLTKLDVQHQQTDAQRLTWSMRM